MSSTKKLQGPVSIIGVDPKYGDSGVSGDMSGVGSIISKVLDIRNVDNSWLEISWTGNAIGSFAVQVSGTGVVWQPINASIPNPSGVNGSWVEDLNQLGPFYLRLVYTKVSGTGTLLVLGGGKEL